MTDSSSSASGLSYKLHPLVIVNVSDHYTRMRLATSRGKQAGSSQNGVERVIGLILGEQTGRVVEICNSFELDYTVSENG